MQCGIGKVNAAAGTVELIRNFQPDCIISTGVAGGIDSELNVMDVVVSRNIVYHDVWCGEGKPTDKYKVSPLSSGVMTPYIIVHSRSIPKRRFTAD